MTGFNTKIGAIVLILLAGSYTVLALATGHTARGEIPADLTAHKLEHGIDVWKTAALLIREGDRAVVADLRDRKDFEMYHLPGSVHVPGWDAKRIGELSDRHDSLVLVADTDEEALKRVREAIGWQPGNTFHYLQGGIRDWYLNFVLPVPLFNDKKPPYGYESALVTVRAYLSAPERKDRQKGLEALSTLARLDYRPVELLQEKKPQPSGTQKKKITGGCG